MTDFKVVAIRLMDNDEYDNSRCRDLGVVTAPTSEAARLEGVLKYGNEMEVGEFVSVAPVPVSDGGVVYLTEDDGR